MKFDGAVGEDGINLRGKELEVVGAEGLHVHVEGVGTFGVAVAVAIGFAAAFLALALYGEHELHGTVFQLLHFLTQRFVTQVVESVTEPVAHEAGTVVVVGRGAEGIELGSAACFEDGLAAILQVGDGTGGLVEHDAEAVALKGDVAGVLCQLHGLFSGRSVGQGRSFGIGSLDRQLFFHLDVAFLGPGHIFVEEELHLDEVFAVGIEGGIVVGQRHFHALACLQSGG